MTWRRGRGAWFNFPLSLQTGGPGYPVGVEGGDNEKRMGAPIDNFYAVNML